MNRNIIKSIGSLFILLLSIYILTGCNNSNTESTEELVYNRNNSVFFDFKVEVDIVRFISDVEVENTTDQDLSFYMIADVSEDVGLVNESNAYACKQGTLEKELYTLKAHTKEKLSAEFNGKKGTKEQKANRLPPTKITFEVLR